MTEETLRIIHEIVRIINIINIQFIIIPYFTVATIDKHKAIKLYKQKNVLKVTSPQETKRKYDDVALHKIKDQKFKEVALEFTKVLAENFPPEALTNFYNNINELKIRKSPITLIFGAAGWYNGLWNTITVKDPKAIYHELFHMASRAYNKKAKITYSGFGQVSIKFGINNLFSVTEIGNGLTEGYTEVLTHRYFDDNHDLINAYSFETNIAELLELIIGREKMTSLYLRGQLQDLIKELKQYATEEEIMKFITRLDLIHSYHPIRKKMMIKESIFDIYEFLLKVNATKLTKQYEEGELDYRGFDILSKAYLKLFNENVKIHSQKYDLKNIDKMYDIILENIVTPIYKSKHLK